MICEISKLFLLDFCFVLLFFTHFFTHRVRDGNSSSRYCKYIERVCSQNRWYIRQLIFLFSVLQKKKVLTTTATIKEKKPNSDSRSQSIFAGNESKKKMKKKVNKKIWLHHLRFGSSVLFSLLFALYGTTAHRRNRTKSTAPPSNIIIGVVFSLFFFFMPILHHF